MDPEAGEWAEFSEEWAHDFEVVSDTLRACVCVCVCFVVGIACTNSHVVDEASLVRRAR